MIGKKVGEVVIKESAKSIKNLLLGYNYINTTEVVVGITEETNASREGGVTNSQLLYLHENGVPSHNIPPRPVLKPAIGQESEKISRLMKEGIKAAILQGRTEQADRSFNLAGMTGRDACKNYILSGENLAPNAPSTIRMKGSSKPLIDKGSMLNSITYAVRRKK